VLGRALDLSPIVGSLPTQLDADIPSLHAREVRVHDVRVVGGRNPAQSSGRTTARGLSRRYRRQFRQRRWSLYGAPWLQLVANRSQIACVRNRGNQWVWSRLWSFRGSAPPDFHLPSVVPGRYHCRRLDHQHDGAAQGMRTVHDAARDRHPVTGAEHERFAPLYLELKPAL
jgi:hypothetical protein